MFPCHVALIKIPKYLIIINAVTYIQQANKIVYLNRHRKANESLFLTFSHSGITLGV